MARWDSYKTDWNERVRALRSETRHQNAGLFEVTSRGSDSGWRSGKHVVGVFCISSEQEQAGKRPD